MSDQFELTAPQISDYVASRVLEVASANGVRLEYLVGDRMYRITAPGAGQATVTDSSFTAADRFNAAVNRVRIRP